MLPSAKIGLLDQLNAHASKLSKESTVGKKWSLDQGDIPGVFRRMYDVADSLASMDGVTWLYASHTPEEIARMRRKESFRTNKEGPPPPTLELQLFQFVNDRRENYMAQMTKLLEVYAKPKWASKEAQGK